MSQLTPGRAAPAGGEALDPARLISRGMRSFLPWSSDAMLRIIIANGIGLGMIVASWFETSGQTSLHEQTGWLKLAIAGVGVCGVANGLWLLRGRQAVGLARVAVLEQYLRDHPDLRRADPDRPTVGAEALVAGEGMTRYHRVGCPLATGKSVTAASPDTHVAEGRRPCELCLS